MGNHYFLITLLITAAVFPSLEAGNKEPNKSSGKTIQRRSFGSIGTHNHPMVDIDKQFAATDALLSYNPLNPQVSASHQVVKHLSKKGDDAKEGGHYATKKGTGAHESESVYDHYSHKKGDDEKEEKKGEYEEDAAKHHSLHDSNNYGDSYDEHEHDNHEGQHHHFDHHNKLGFSKGYRDKYHKDEKHKVDSFWSNGHEKGAYKKFGQHSRHHHNEDKDSSKKSNHKEGNKGDKYERKGMTSKGKDESDSGGYKGHHGHESENSHSSKYYKGNRSNAHKS